MFLIASVIPMAGSAFISQISKVNRKKPYFQYFKVALAVSWILALVALYFSWYAATNSQ